MNNISRTEHENLVSYLRRYSDKSIVYYNSRLSNLGIKSKVKSHRTSKDKYSHDARFKNKQGTTLIVERYEGDVNEHKKGFRDILVKKALKRIDKVKDQLPFDYRELSEEELIQALEALYTPVSNWLGAQDFEETRDPFNVEVSTWGNVALNEGWNNSGWSLIIGGSGTAFNNATAELGVGDSTTAATVNQTDLQASSNKLYQGMETGFPSIGSSRDIDFKSQFGSSQANFDWREFTVRNGSTADENLFRKLSNVGTKSSGQTYNLTVNIQIT